METHLFKLRPIAFCWLFDDDLYNVQSRLIDLLRALIHVWHMVLWALDDEGITAAVPHQCCSLTSYHRLVAVSVPRRLMILTISLICVTWCALASSKHTHAGTHRQTHMWRDARCTSDRDWQAGKQQQTERLPVRWSVTSRHHCSGLFTWWCVCVVSCCILAWCRE